MTLVGLVLIGMSQWSTIKINAGGASIDQTLRAQLQEAAAAAQVVASQAQQAAAAAETTREQVAVLARQLETRNVLPSAAARSIRATLDTAPRADLERLRSAQNALGRVTRP